MTFEKNQNEDAINLEVEADKSAMAANIEQTVKRTALRKVRKLVDKLDSEHAAKERTEKIALIVAAVVVIGFAAWFALGLIASDEKYERGQAVPLPDKVVIPKSD
ncbi:MAG: hypothetical protein JWN94_1785 [Betaproteobacteria bacterium]|nr:hypothetical protein [Betaproteobacteria bacterium]